MVKYFYATCSMCHGLSKLPNEEKLHKIIGNSNNCKYILLAKCQDCGHIYKVGKSDIKIKYTIIDKIYDIWTCIILMLKLIRM